MPEHTSRTPQRTSLLMLSCLLVALACNAPSLIAEPTATVAPTAAPPIPAGPASLEEAGVTLTVANGLAENICTLHFSYATASSWGINRLDAAEPLVPGEERDFLLPPERYDLIAMTCSGNLTGEARNLDLSANLTHTIVAPDPGITDVVLWPYDECQLPALDGNSMITIRTPWMATSARLARHNGELMTVIAYVDGEEVVRSSEPSPVMDGVPFSDLGCPGDDDPETFVYWDLPLGQLEAGSHLIAVEYSTSEEIYDGYDFYPPGEIGGLERTIEVAEGR